MGVKNYIYISIKSYVRNLLARNNRLARIVLDIFHLSCVENVNISLYGEEQKKLLFCYLEFKGVDYENASHANYLHFLRMLQCFKNKNYCIDICYCNDLLSLNVIQKKKYDVIVGFGSVFKKACKLSSNKDAKKVLFVTENYPPIVQEKYKERLDYFKERHPLLDAKCSPVRDGYYDKECFEVSNSAIVMSSLYNISPMRKHFKNIFQVNANVLLNSRYVFNKDSRINVINDYKKRFLWFGSSGLIHKGVDILLDAFREINECEIDFYGVNSEEKVLFNKMRPENAYDCGFVKVQSDDFLRDVVNKHVFIVMPSCSEGMSTAVATCMAHGLIPIVSKESGFDPCDCIIQLADCKVETVRKCIADITAMKNKDILDLSEKAYIYAINHFSLDSFESSFMNALDGLEV